ncbi:unannotated protein [freshwater metagenome]|uniref:Unannotated protein n=1 Tax=freshwater metagenome TaxID=449393 RepID=A0A6J7A3Q8_9ZZZZ
MRVAEHLLPAQHAVVAEHDVLPGRQIRQFGETLIEPVGVRVLGSELCLELAVVDDAALRGVHEEHPSGLEAPLLHDPRLVDIDDADLARHDDEIIGGYPEAARAQAVAVQHGTDHRSVGERNARRAVPRLDHRRVEPVERPLGGLHRGVVLPRLGDEHEHGVRQRPPAEVQQLDGLVEPCGVRASGRAYREGALEVRDVRCGEHGLAGAHPVLVALHRVDLAVVGDKPIRVRQGPRRKRVRGEATVHQRQCRVHSLVGEVGVELAELRRGEHALVHERPRRQGREVGGDVTGQFVLDALAHDVDLAVQFEPGCSRRVGEQEQLERRHDVERGLPEDRGIGGDQAPPERVEALIAHDRLDRRPGPSARCAVGGQECHSDCVGTRRRQVEGKHSAQEGVGNLDEDPGAVTGVLLGAGGPAVLEVAQRGQTLCHDVVRANALQVGHERHAAGVALEPWVVEPVGRGKI